MSLPLSQRLHPVRAFLILVLALLAAAPLRAGVNRWTSIGPDGGGVTALSFSANGRTVWAALKGAGVFRSADNGRTWTAASRGLSREVYDLAASPAAPGRVYAATSFGVFRTDDAGLHWTAANTGLPVVNGRVAVVHMATEPTDPAAVWAAGPGNRALYRSTNLGAQWRYAGRGLKGVVLDVAPHPKTAGVVFAATDRGLFRSADSGGHWSPSGLRGLEVSRVVFDRVQPRHLYAITLELGTQELILGTVFVSDDGGASWKGSRDRLPGHGGFELEADPAHAGTAWVSLASGFYSVFKTTDRGEHWQAVLEADRLGALALAANPLRPGTVLAGNLPRGSYSTGKPALFRTDDGGTSWSPSGTGIAAATVSKVLPDPSKPGALYVQGIDGSLWKRAGAGQPFTRISTGIDRSGSAELILDPKTPSTLYLADDPDLYKSVDAGATWQKLSSPGLDSIALDPAHPSTLYGVMDVGFDSAITRSDDGGFSWNTLISAEEFATTWLSVTGTALYADGVDTISLSRNRLRRSTDGGTTWTTLLEPIPDYARVTALAEDPRDPQRLWTSFVQRGFQPNTGGIYRSTDGGAHWSLSRVTAGNLPVFALAVDPRNSNRVWAASARAVFLSEDGGATWTSFSEGLLAADVLDLRLDPFDPDTLYAGTDGGSVYTFTRRTGE